MAFTPISLPIQEILETDFITDIRLIDNANFSILKDKLEDLINNLEINTNTLSIGTDNPINYIKTQSVIMQDTGFIFQTGTPLQIISRLYKNGSSQSIFDVDFINVNKSISVDGITVNDIAVNDTLTVGGKSTFNNVVEFKTQVIESKETISVLLQKSSATVASARITLTSTSRQNILLKLVADANVGPTQVYNGVDFGTITDFILYIDFDTNNPPTQNAKFTFTIVDVRANNIPQTLLSDTITPSYSQGLVTTQNVNIKFKAGLNNNTTNQILLDYNLEAISTSLGITPPNTIKPYGSKVSLLYIIDENNNDRLLIESMIGMSLF